MAQVGGATAQATHAGPRTPLQNERQQQKEGLASWWRNFKRSDKKPQEAQVPQGIFGIPLQQSIRYANVAISLLNDEGHHYIYGYVPIVVAKCGVFLKEKATETEGIFRLAGSEKRIKELKIAFDSPDRFGKGLDWTGYTVHDAANILRRYFLQLPEPIIPLDFYDRFRNPLRNHQAQAVGSIEAQSPSVGEFDPDAAIREYQNLITNLPPLNRQLLLYILDLLAVFASKSEVNKMTTPNLAAVFQPGILSHPQHDMAPPEYRLSQDVLIFLIENQDSFIIGMEGTAADPETVRDVQNGTPPKAPSTPTTPGRSKTIVGRSSSNASTRAESLRKTSDVQRNASGSSKLSKRSENGPTPVATGMSSPATSVHRSNTVPSRRDGSSAHSPRFSREKVTDPATPSSAASPTVADPNQPKSESLQSTPVVAAAALSPVSTEPPPVTPSESTAPVTKEAAPAVSRDVQTPKKEAAPLLTPAAGTTEQAAERSPAQTPSTSPGRFLDVFKQSPQTGGETRKPNKLQKKPPVPVSSLSSAQSSSHSLHNEEKKEGLQRSTPPRSPSTGDATVEKLGEQPTPVPAQPTSSTLQPVPVRTEAGRNLSADNALRPTISPSGSFRSGTESDADMVGDDLPKEQAGQPEKEKKRHRWRFSRSHNKLESSPAPSPQTFNTLTAKEQTTSRSTVGSSSGAPPRRSFQEPTALAPSATDPPTAAEATPIQGQTFSSTSTSTDPVVFSDSEREKRGPMSWIRGKMRTEKRASTPERGRDRSDSRPGAGVMASPPQPLSAPERQRTDSEASLPPAGAVASAPPVAAATGTTAAAASPPAVAAATAAAASPPVAALAGPASTHELEGAAVSAPPSAPPAAAAAAPAPVVPLSAEQVESGAAEEQKVT